MARRELYVGGVQLRTAKQQAWWRATKAKLDEMMQRPPS
jgi:hypothetical protein